MPTAIWTNQTAFQQTKIKYAQNIPKMHFESNIEQNERTNSIRKIVFKQCVQMLVLEEEKKQNTRKGVDGDGDGETNWRNIKIINVLWFKM